MREIGAFEAKNTLGGLLDRVEHGEEILINRRGRPVARLVPARTGVDREKARAAAASLRALATDLQGQGLRWSQLKRYRDEGRR
jgi:prevent-host-death family protein